MLPATRDDPRKRKPDITVAKQELGWAPRVRVEDGLVKAIAYFKKELEESGEIKPTGSVPSKPHSKSRGGYR